MNNKYFENLEPEVIVKSIKQDKGNSFVNINDDLDFKGKKIIGIKDIHVWENHLVTACSETLSNYISPYSSTVVKLLEENNYHIIGTLNMDEFAMGSTNQSSFHGEVDNVIDSEHVPGGSSGGSAYAVAKGLIPVATGTDTGGSIRQPASFNGIYGMKPTYGLISRYGTIAFASSFDTVGVLSNSIEDNIETLKILAQNDNNDSTNYVPENYNLDINEVEINKFKNMKIAVIKEWMEAIKGAEIETLILSKIEFLKEQGAHVQEVSIPSLKYSFELYMTLAYSEASSNLSRYDGIRYGIKNSTNDFSSYRHVLGKEVRKRLLLGAWMTSQSHSKEYYNHAQKIRTKIKNQFQEIFANNDIVIGPTVSTGAFSKTVEQDSKALYLSDFFLIPANLAGIPAMSVPIGKNKEGYPVGMQILANHYEENKIYKAAIILEGDKND